MDFGGRIAQAQNSVNRSNDAFNTYQQKADAAENKFNQGMDNYQRKNFGDIYRQARDEFANTDEIKKARGLYSSARDAVNQLSTVINNLPESIRQQFGGTSMSEAQRARALGQQYDSLGRTQNMLNTNYQNAANDYNQLADRGLKEAMAVAQGNDSREWNALNALQNAFSTLLGQRNTAYSQNQTDRDLLAKQYSARDTWESNELDRALARWKVQQENARAAADRAAQFGLQKYLMDRKDSAEAANRSWQEKMRSAALAAEEEKNRLARNSAFNSKLNNYNYMNDIGNNIAQGLRNVTKWGPLALFGGGSLWG